MKTAAKLILFLCAFVTVALLTGCANQEKMYASRVEAQTKRDENALTVEKQKWAASAACYSALGMAANSAEPLVRMGAMLALDKCQPKDSAAQGSFGNIAAQQAPLPDVPESGALTTLKVTATLAGALHPWAQTAMGFLAQKEANRSNQAIQLGQQNMFQGMFASQATALSGVATNGLTALKEFGTTALKETKPAQPNYTVNGGVLNTGSGTATLNSGENSGNSGAINITKDSPVITNNCAAGTSVSAPATNTAGVGTAAQPAGAGSANTSPAAPTNTNCKG
jgi:hypothetical protein